jgi:hypothetical protein
MPKLKNDSAPSPVKPGMPEPTTDTAEAAASKDEADIENQVAFATFASDCPEATATSPVRHDAIGNQDLPEQATDANPSPADPGIAESTSPQDDTSEAAATKDEAGAVSQLLAAPSNTPESNLLPTAEEYVTQPAELDDGGCFEPLIRQGPGSTTFKPLSEPKPPSFWELPNASEKPLLPPRVATAPELFTWIKMFLLALTHLAEDAAALAVFWVISAWFHYELTVLPCLVLTGPAHDAVIVLHVLSQFCPQPALLAGFGRGQLGALIRYRTLLISEPNLDKRTAHLLSGLTDRKFLVVRGPKTACHSRLTAIYAGENPETHKIQNSIHIHIAPTNAALPAPPQWLQKMIERVPVHLEQYCDKNLRHILHSMWVPSGLSSETAAIATALGCCIVDALELRQKLVVLLKTRDQQRLSEMSNTTQAVILEATLALCRDGRDHAYCREIAAEANRLLEFRGERVRPRPEHVGRQFKNLGLPTHRLSQTGNGLRFDKATVARIHELASMYMVDVMEDTPTETENLHSSQTAEKKDVE